MGGNDCRLAIVLAMAFVWVACGKVKSHNQPPQNPSVVESPQSNKKSPQASEPNGNKTDIKPDARSVPSPEPGVPTIGAKQLPAINWVPNPFWTSVGFRLGYLLNIKFQWDRLVVWAYEAQMILGFGTIAGPVVDLNCYTIRQAQASHIQDQAKGAAILRKAAHDCYLFTNPIAMSSYDPKYYEMLARMRRDQPVVVYYAIPSLTIAGLFTKTKDWIYGIYPVEPNLNLEPSYHIPWSRMPVSSHVNPEEGTIQGRVVQLSVEHPLRKTYEAIIQEQANQNNFTAMSVNDVGMFDYLKQAMLTGKPLSINFVRLFAPEGWAIHSVWPYNTNYRITGVAICGCEDK